jgi:hypothetical protein
MMRFRTFSHTYMYDNMIPGESWDRNPKRKR